MLPRDKQLDIVVVLKSQNLTPQTVAAFAWKEAAEYFAVAEDDLPVQKLTITFDEEQVFMRATVVFVLEW